MNNKHCENCKYAKKMDDENELECIRESVETIRIVVDENDSCRWFDENNKITD